jgi:hypothetical protein
VQVDALVLQGPRQPLDEDIFEIASLSIHRDMHAGSAQPVRPRQMRPRAGHVSIGGSSSDAPRTGSNRLASSAAVSSPFRASGATFALNLGACCLHFDISDLLLVEDQQTANRSLGQCPNFGAQISQRSSHSPLSANRNRSQAHAESTSVRRYQMTDQGQSGSASGVSNLTRFSLPALSSNRA